MQVTKFFYFILVFFLSVSTAFAILPEQNKEPIRIGALLCLSGNCADWGTAALRGAELALSEINQRGGVLGRKLELKTEDTRESISGAQAVSGFHKMVDVDKIKFIIGPSWSPGALAIAPLVAAREDLLLITPSASAEDFSRSGTNLFNMRPAERLATEGLADFAIRSGWSKVAVFASQQAAEMTQGRIFAAVIQKNGDKIVKHIETDPNLSDVRAEALQIVSSKPEAVFLMAYNQMEQATSRLRQLGYTGPILAISLDDNRVSAVMGKFDGFYVAKALAPTQNFIEKYQDTYKELPGLSAENGYDAVIALTRAIELAENTDPKQVARVLPQIEFDGAAGRIKFNIDRGVDQLPALYIVRQTHLEPREWSNAG